MQLSESEAQEYLIRLDVISVEEDSVVQLLPYNQSKIKVGVASLIDGEVPYGIKMVQALEVSDVRKSGIPFASKVSTC